MRPERVLTEICGGPDNGRLVGLPLPLAGEVWIPTADWSAVERHFLDMRSVDLVADGRWVPRDGQLPIYDHWSLLWPAPGEESDMLLADDWP